MIFVSKHLNVKTVLFQTIQFSISTQFSSIWPIDRTLSIATTLGQSELGSDGNEGVLRIPQSSCITGTSQTDCLVSYIGHSFGGSLTPLQRSCWIILQHQLTGQLSIWRSLMGFQSNFCCSLLSNSVLGFSILTLCYFVGLTSWSMKAVKKLYRKKTGKEDRNLLYFDFIARFNNHSVGEEIISESKWNGCVSQLRC